MRLNWSNYLFLYQDGYGRMGRGFVRALLQGGHDVHPFTIDTLDMPSWYTRAQGIHFDVATVQLMPPHHMRHLPGRSFAYSMHESMSLPDGWAEHINQKCQWLLVPSPWLIEVFEKAGVKVPIMVVPGGVDIDECPILTQPRTRSRPYTFLCLGDRGSRKGWDLVWTAFFKAFDYRNKDVRLIVKCRSGSLPPDMDFSYSSDSRLSVWREDVEKMVDVFAHADACINPNRCEGYGMWPREAAACGLPTVVTRWSGTADDADEWAIPLDHFTLVDSQMENCGGLWAEPDLDEIVEKMRGLYFHQDEARAKGLQAAKWMRENATYSHAVDKLADVMSKCLGGPPPRLAPTADEVRQNADQNKQSLALLRQLSPNGHKVEAVHE